MVTICIAASTGPPLLVMVGMSGMNAGYIVLGAPWSGPSGIGGAASGIGSLPPLPPVAWLLVSLPHPQNKTNETIRAIRLLITTTSVDFPLAHGRATYAN